MPLSTIYEHVERAIKVAREMFLDRQYVVRDGEIVIVDEFTGRLGEGRKWRAGIHQAVEAKEGVEITFATNQAARITVQDFFLRYNRLAGMTGTASTSAGELRKIYKCRVDAGADESPADSREAADARVRHRPRTSGRRSSTTSSSSISAAGRCSSARARSTRARSCRNCSRPAASSTPCSTRGTSPRKRRSSPTPASAAKSPWPRTWPAAAPTSASARAWPSLAACTSSAPSCTKSQRIDRQLIGRCGRQGDPGTYRQFLALDDEILLTGFGPKKAKKLKEQGEHLAGRGPLSGFESLFYKAQRKVERRHFRDRKVLLYHEKERQKMQRADEPGSVSGYGGVEADVVLTAESPSLTVARELRFESDRDDLQAIPDGRPRT